MKINRISVLRPVITFWLILLASALFAEDITTLAGGISVRGIARDSIGMMWLKTPDGYFSFDGYNLRNADSAPVSFQEAPDEDLLSAVKLPEGLTYVSGIVRGKSPDIVYISTWYSLIKYNLRTRTIEENLPMPVVKTMLSDGDRIWLGTDNGLYIYDDGNLRRYVHDAYSPDNSLASNVVWSLFKDNDGNIWAGTDDGLTIFRNRDKVHWIRLTEITGSHDGNRITTFMTDAAGRAWLGGSDGIICVTGLGTENSSYRWHRMDSEEYPIRHNRIRAIAEDKDGRIFVGGDGGLMLYNEATTRFEAVTIEQDEHNWIYDITPLEDGRLSIDCLEDTYILDGKTFAVIESRKRIKRDNPVFVDNAGNKWRRDRRSGMLWTGGADKLGLADGEILDRAVNGTKASFTGLAVNGQPYDTASGFPEEKIRLADNENNIVLYFSDFSYSPGLHASYRYRINGGAWIPVIGPQNTLHLTKLEPGDYTVEIAPGTGGEPREDTVSSLTVTILPPWHGTPAMKILYACIALAFIIIIAIIIRQRHHLRSERHNREQIVRQARQTEEALQRELVETARGNSAEAGPPSENDTFLLRVTGLIESNIRDPKLSPAMLTGLTGVSGKQLYRRIKQLTGMTVVEYIRKYRMEKAGELLASGNFTVAEVMYRVGYSNASYFSRSFSAFHGKTPTEFREAFRQAKKQRPTDIPD